ncbi:MAG TPA: MBL fold metallo-hydrolase [Anaerolineales bacterium]|nr:MBL fold metallo-hydrolase [Anaerolineales bacterium]HLO31175.1 MBL fold metallo-hydrolase [Anaerolineales bacterium]
MYVANEGFLIRTSNKKILIDALFGNFESDWCDTPSQDTIGKTEKGMEPFDQIDVILVSHAHIDHFNAEIVSKHLENNESGMLICPRQVAQALKKDERFEKISPRVKEITPEYERGIQKISVKGMEIQVWRLAHSPYYIENEETKEKQNRHEHVQNLGFTIEVDCKRIFHGGDWTYDGTGDKQGPLDGEEKIDFAFLSVEAYLRLYGSDSRTIDKHKKPKNIVLMHLYPAGNIEDLTEEEKKTLSGVTIFKSTMETRHFSD